MSKVLLSKSAQERLKAITHKTALSEIIKCIDALEVFPKMGSMYNPVYKASRLPFLVRVVYAAQYGLYYTYDEKTDTVNILYVLNQRMNPTNRFDN